MKPEHEETFCPPLYALVTTRLQVVKDGLGLLTAQGIGMASGALYLVMIARLIPKQDLAIIPVYALLAGSGSLVAGLGLETSIMKEIPALLATRRTQEAGRFVRCVLVFHLGLSLLLAAAVICSLAEPISSLFFKTQAYARLVRLMAPGIVVQRVFETASSALFGCALFQKQSRLMVAGGLLSKVLALSLYLQWGNAGYIIGLTAAQAAAAIAALVCVRHLVLRGWRDLQWPSPFGIRYSLPFYGNGFLRFLRLQADQALVGALLAPAQLASYFIGRRLLDLLISISSALVNPIAPRLAGLKVNRREDLAAALKLSFRYLLLVFIPLCALTACLARPLLEVFAGSRYLDAVTPFAILTLSAVAYVVDHLLMTALLMVATPFTKLKQELLSCGFALASTVALTWLLGTSGAAIGVLAGYVGGALVGGTLLKAYAPLAFDVAHAAQTAVAATGGATAVLLLRACYYSPFLLPLYGLAGSAVIAILLWHQFTSDDVALVSALLPSPWRQWIASAVAHQQYAAR